MSEQTLALVSDTGYEETLLQTVAKGDLELLKSLQECDYDINQSGFRGVTPFMVAVRNGHTELVKNLCKNGADINRQTRNGESALYIACDKVNLEMVEILLEAGCDVNSTTNDLHPQTGCSPLMVALPSSYEIDVNKKKKSVAIKIVTLLLSSGCNIEARDWAGNTALHLAAGRHDLHTVCLLAEKGANLHIRNKFGLTAFEEAIQPNTQRYDVASMLLLYGYDIESNPSNPHPLTSIIRGIEHAEAKYFVYYRLFRIMLLQLLKKVIHLDGELKEIIEAALGSCQSISSEDKYYCEQILAIKRPRSFQELCRGVIRKAIRTSVIKGIHSLPVPKSIKQFLALDFDIYRNDPLQLMELQTAYAEEFPQAEKLPLMLSYRFINSLRNDKH